jgi:CheY-like chemotaxis protein
MVIQRPTSQMPTIMIIENDVGNRILVERIVSISGYRYLSAADGRAALELLEHHPVDMILTDLSMPGLDGFGIARLLRARPEFADIPIVALTAHAYEAERQKALRMGCTDVLVKPYRPKELLALIERHLAGAAQA